MIKKKINYNSTYNKKWYSLKKIKNPIKNLSKLFFTILKHNKLKFFKKNY